MGFVYQSIDTKIYNNESLSNMTQMQYLLSVLFEEPLNLVRSLNISSDNYQIAYNLLREWYNEIANLPLNLNQIMDLT